jgi:hypothetical protein
VIKNLPVAHTAILVTLEAGIGRIMVPGQPGDKVNENPS